MFYVEAVCFFITCIILDMLFFNMLFGDHVNLVSSISFVMGYFIFDIVCCKVASYCFKKSMYSCIICKIKNRHEADETVVLKREKLV